MRIEQIDPSLIAIDTMNERQDPDVDEAFVENVRAVGVKQPPMVRELNGGMEASMGAEYSVVLGGRRVDAATQAGLEEIPVIVVDWDDAEALESSITENIQEFRQEVSKKDRAKAIQRLRDLNGWDNSDVAESIGVNPNTVRQWLEPLHPDWKDTSIHADNSTPGQGDDKEPTYKAMRTSRSIAGGGQDGEALVQKFEQEGVRETKDIREVEKKVNQKTAPDDPPEKKREVAERAIEEVAESKPKKGEDRLYIDFTLTGHTARSFKELAQERGTTERDLARIAIDDLLRRAEYR